MKTARFFGLPSVIIALTLTGCASQDTTDMDAALTLYHQNQVSDALPHFQRAVEQSPDDADRQAWLAESYRRLGKQADAVDHARAALEIDTCHATAHCVLGNVYNRMYGNWPGADRQRAWDHLMKAVACDPMDGNAWLDIWTEALYHGRYELADSALHAMVMTGMLTPSILAYNRWVLHDVPQDAILLTNGDMDTYPAVALQVVEGFRTDIAIVNYSLLNTPWYAKYIRMRYGIDLPFTDEQLEHLTPFIRDDERFFLPAHQIMIGWLEAYGDESLERPIAVAETVSDLGFAEESDGHFCRMGAYKLWQSQAGGPDMDTAMVRSSLESVDVGAMSGPMASADDRSSVRAATTNHIVTNITALALRYAETLIASDRETQALAMIDWAEDFEARTAEGPVYTDRVAQLRSAAQSP